MWNLRARGSFLRNKQKLERLMAFQFFAKKSLSRKGQAQIVYQRFAAYAFSRARVLVVRSQTSAGPKY